MLVMAPAVRRRDGGFTLVELMTVVTVLALVGALATPGFAAFAASQSIRSAANDLASDLMLARNEALKRNATVAVAPAGTDWAAGWTVTAGGTVVSSRGASLQPLAFDNAPGAISFNLYGRVATPAVGVRITVSSPRATDASRRCVELDLTGRARVGSGACT
jgi:type IV fimbrial biogenesis protein FimT